VISIADGDPDLNPKKISGMLGASVQSFIYRHRFNGLPAMILTGGYSSGQHGFRFRSAGNFVMP